MNKSELKKRILESLTPDEASKVDVKYKEIYAGMVGKNPLKMKKYDNPDKVAYGRAINLIKKESAKLSEKLGKDADLGDHIEDFQKSDAPQFKGKSKKKINQMAQAAFLNKEEQKLDEIDAIMEKEDKLPVNDIKKAIKALLKKEGGAAGLAPILKLAKDFDNVTQIDIEDILDNDMKDVEKHRDGDYILKEDAQEKSEKNYSNYFKKMDKNRLEELVKAALMGPMNETSTDKYDDNPALKGKQSELPDGLQKAIIKKSDGKANESFDSLVKKVDKSKGYTKKEAEKVAGSIAAKKRAGAGKGPTAKQKKRMAETILKELRGNINEAEVSPQIAADKAIKTLATKLEKAPEMDKLAAQVAKNPKLMAQLEKAVKDAGVNVELAEDESGLDMRDMKTMALNLAKKSKSVNEKQEYLDDDDGSVDVGLGTLSWPVK